MRDLPTAPSATTTVEVRYAETDQMGIVHHAVYPIWFEIARTALCRQSGFSYAEIEASGYYLLVTHVSVDYRQSVRYPDSVTTICRLEKLASRGLRFAYEVFANDALRARGTTKHVWFEIAAGRPCRIPAHLAHPFAQLLPAGA